MAFTNIQDTNPNGNPAFANNNDFNTSFQAHHVIPASLFDKFKLLEDLKVNGKWDIDDFQVNGIWLPTNKDAARELGFAMHFNFNGEHSRYNKYIIALFNVINDEYLIKLGALNLSDPDYNAKLSALLDDMKLQVQGLHSYLRDGLVVKKILSNGVERYGTLFSVHTDDTSTTAWVGIPDLDPNSSDNTLAKAELTRIKTTSAAYQFDAAKLGNVHFNGKELYDPKAGIADGVPLTAMQRAENNPHLNKITPGLNGIDKASTIVAFGAIILGGVAYFKNAYDEDKTLNQMVGDIANAIDPSKLTAEGVAVMAGTMALGRALFLLGPAGAAVAIGLDALGSYQDIKGAITELQKAFPNWTFLSETIEFMNKMEGIVQPGIDWLINNFMQILPSIVIADGQIDGLGTNGVDFMIGRGTSKLYGYEGNDKMLHFGNGNMDGGNGNDFLLAINPKDATSTPGLPSSMEIRGGAGSDWVVSLGGDGAKLYGGAGNDWVAGYGGTTLMWGGDGVNSDTNADIFTVSSGNFIMDATNEDYVTWGIPLFRITGGMQASWQENNLASWQPASALLGNAGIIGGGILGIALAIADAVTMTTFSFQRTVTNQLAIYNFWGRAGVGVIENYDLDLETGFDTQKLAFFEKANDNYLTIYSAAV